MEKINVSHRTESPGRRSVVPVILTCMAITSLTACQESLPEAPDTSPEGDFAVVNLPKFAAPASSAGFDMESQGEAGIELFQFSRGLLKKRLKAKDSDESPVVFSKEPDTKIYAVYGCDVFAVEGETQEEVFSKETVSCKGMMAAPIFFTGVAQLDPGSNSMEIPMERGVARIDINNLNDLLVIEEVKIEGAAEESYVFHTEGSTCESDKVTYTLGFDGISGLEKGICTLYESSTPVSVCITGEQKGKPMAISMETPAIKRNKVYTVTLEPADPGAPIAVRASVSVADWEDGEEYSTAPDATHGIRLDLAASSLPASVSYNETTSTLDVPAEGLDELRIAFRSDLRIDIDGFTLSGDWVEKDSLVSRGAFSITGREVKEVGNDIVTVYSLKILPQLVARSEYTVDLGVRKASMTTVYDHLRIRVAEHPDQIQTVRIAGHEWMCFNATSSRLEDQVYPVRGMSVDDMYREHFTESLGMYFQYGKANPFSPWTSNDPNQFAAQTRDIPWRTVGSMPLPEGFHVPSLNEWKDLIPTGTTIPASYRTPSGDSIKASVVTLPGTLETPSAAVNAKNYKKRYVLFESVTTGAKLYLPIMGLKANNTAEVPGASGFNYDVRTAYWASEERYIWLIDFKTSADGTEGALLQQNRWNADGFLPVRGVKD